MNIALAAAALAPGVAVGSFLNVVASRVPLRIPIGRSRSACPACGRGIRARDNVPLLSFVLLRGRCRDCRVRIPLRYPLVESLTAVLVAACFSRFGVSGDAAVAAAFCAILVALSAIDLEHRIVPNRIVLPAAAVALVARTALDPGLEWLLAALGASGFLLVAALVYPRGMGMGDVKLALLLGAALGAPVAVALAAGMVAALVPAALAVVAGRSVRGLEIPFVPFLALGSVVALFVGDGLLGWYLGILS